MPTGSAKGRMRFPGDRRLRVLGWGQKDLLPGTEGHFGEERKQKIRKQPGKASKWCAVGANGQIQNREKHLVTVTQHRAKREAEAEPHRPPWKSDTLLSTLVCVPVALQW